MRYFIVFWIWEEESMGATYYHASNAVMECERFPSYKEACEFARSKSITGITEILEESVKEWQ